MAQLLELPVEILQRIARFLSCSSALSLTRVSRRLHDACNDRHVFRYIALHSLKYNPVLRLKKHRWPEGHGILERASLDDTIRVAYAVEQAIQRADAEANLLWTPEIPECSPKLSHSDISQWLPQLLALHYPGCTYCKTKSLLAEHLELGRRLELAGQLCIPRNGAKFINLGFCIAWLVLQALAGSTEESKPFEKEECLQSKLSNEYMFSVCWGIQPPDDWTHIGSFDLVRGSASIVPLVNSILAGGNFGQVPLPVPSKMDFSSFMEIPWVFSGNAQLFSECHIQKMTDPLFLTGEWMGYYTDQRLASHRYFALIDPPMEDMNIVVKTPEETTACEPDVKGHILPHSYGSDSHGAFTLRGSVFRDGRIEFTKCYASYGWEWSYRGIVIPFGVVGCWSDMDGSFGGHFWIWKREWCHNQTT